MLTRDERNTVQDELSAILAGQMDQRVILSTIFRTESNQILTKLPLTLTSADQYSEYVVGYCLVSRWTRTPALLDLLLNYLVTSKGIGRFAAILERVRQEVDPNPSPYEATWLEEVHPFFDRNDLRQRVRSLVEGSGRPILLVTAPPETFGRTYSRRFLQHVQTQSAADTHVLVAELSPGTGPSYTVDDLARTLASQLGEKDILPRTSSSYAKQVAWWVLALVQGKDGRWIIVLDGFGQNGLNPEVREAVEALASLIPAGLYRERVRLVLLDYPETLPQVSPADILEEVLLPAANLTQKDLEPCITAWDTTQRRNGNPGYPPDRILDMAKEIFESAPSSGKGRLESFNQALSDLLRVNEIDQDAI